MRFCANRFAVVCFSPSLFALLLGCASPYQPPQAVYKTVQILSDPPGARIEINGNYVGDAPLTVKVKADTEYNRFYSNTLIRAYPKENGYVQTKYFAPGTSEGLDLPDRIFFDTNLRATYPQIPIQIQ
jgi:PEGA domain-containing protein